MRAFMLPSAFRSPARLLTSISVRTRIIVLALVPAIGFFINGFTYVLGEHDVGQAFQTVQNSGDLADASRNFKGAVTEMRIIVKDFRRDPREELVTAFQQQQSIAVKSLDTIAESMQSENIAIIGAMRTDLGNLNKTFSKLVEESGV